MDGAGVFIVSKMTLEACERAIRSSAFYFKVYQITACINIL